MVGSQNTRFLATKQSLKLVERKEEIQTVYDTEFASERLSQVRDIFLFSCYIGLAYVDVKKLSKSHVNIGIDVDMDIHTLSENG